MAHIQHHQAQDVDDPAEALDGFRQFYEQLGRGRFHGSVWQLMTGQGSLLRESSERSLRQRFTPPAVHVTLALPLAVQAGSMFAGQPLGRESLMVLRSGDEYEKFGAGHLALPPEVIATAPAPAGAACSPASRNACTPGRRPACAPCA